MSLRGLKVFPLRLGLAQVDERGASPQQRARLPINSQGFLLVIEGGIVVADAEVRDPQIGVVEGYVIGGAVLLYQGQRFFVLAYGGGVVIGEAVYVGYIEVHISQAPGVTQPGSEVAAFDVLVECPGKLAPLSVVVAQPLVHIGQAHTVGYLSKIMARPIVVKDHFVPVAFFEINRAHEVVSPARDHFEVFALGFTQHPLRQVQGTVG